MLKVYIATGNKHKVEEISLIFREYGILLERIESPKLEIQSERLEDIAAFAAESLETSLRPVIVEDAGLFVRALRGFPGPYSSYVYKTVGIDGILRLMEGKSDRRAYFLSAIALRDWEDEVEVFTGRTDGYISVEPRGVGGFGFDPIFIPVGESRTFAEMTVGEKNMLSHRAKASRRVAEWLLKNI